MGTKESVHFKFMLDEEVRRQSVVKITNSDLLDILDKPIPGGLYDPAMGPLDDGSLCKSCGQSFYHCNGHCGHIDLVLPSYNPLLFNTLNKLLNKVCFYCFHFRSSRGEVESSFSQLKLIEKGDIVGAKKLRLRQDLQDKKETELMLPDDIIDREDIQESHASHPAFLSDDEHHNENNDQASWDSCQLTEAISVVKEFLKKKEKKCMNCKRKNPKIDKPTFGWFRVSGMSSADIKWNAIRSGRLDVTQSGEGEDKASFEVVNSSDYSWKVDSETGEAHHFNVATDSTKKGIKNSENEKRKLNQGLQDKSNYFDGPLLPSEVKDILRRLWENEASISSYISGIQHQFSGTITGYSMFFLETIRVPPIKSRPPAKDGDSVMEHPHTRLLGKVLQSNIALGNAHMNNSDHPRIICGWIDLQQSINVLFDTKTASRTASKTAFSQSQNCQFLEKKEAIYRQWTMGYPPYFGLRLRHPQGVAHLHWNDAILKGQRH